MDPVTPTPTSTPQKRPNDSKLPMLGLDFIHVGSRPSTQRTPRRPNTQRSDRSDRQKIPIHNFSRTMMSGTTVESWPSPSHSMSWTAESAATSVKPKPPLVQSLEDFMSKELAMLGSSATNLERLRVYREMFQIFINHFKSYAPMLSAVMNEYDSVIQMFSVSATEAQKFSSTLHHTTHAHEAKLQEVEREARTTIEAKNREIEELQKYVLEERQTRLDIERECQELRSHNDVLQQEKQDDLEKMLSLIKAVKDSDARNRYYTEKAHRLGTKVEKMKDLQVLLTETEAKLSEVKESYRETVSRKEHIQVKSDLEREVGTLRAEEMKLRRMYASRGSQIEKLEKVVMQLQSDRARLKDKTRPVTPRPEWGPIRNDFPDLFDDDVGSSSSLVVKKSTCTAVEVLAQRLYAEIQRAQEFSDSVDVIKGELDDVQVQLAQYKAPRELDLIGFGIGADVPSFLRAFGVFKRSCRTRDEVIKVIHTLWQQKLASDIDKNERTLVGDYLTEYAVSNFGETAAMAWIYNFREDCLKYRSGDARCEVFLGALDGSLPQRLHFDALVSVEETKKSFSAATTHGGSTRKRRFKRKEFLEFFTPSLRGKPQKNVDRLIAELGKDSTIDVDELLSSNSKFVDVLWEQAEEEALLFYAKLLSAVLDTVGDDGNIHPTALQEAVTKVAPSVGEDVLQELCSVPDLEDSMSMSQSNTMDKEKEREKPETIPLEIVVYRLHQLPIVQSVDIL